MRASSFSWFFFKRRRVDYSLLMRIICPIVKCSIQKSIRLVADDDGQFSIVKYEQHWIPTLINCGQGGEKDAPILLALFLASYSKPLLETIMLRCRKWHNKLSHFMFFSGLWKKWVVIWWHVNLGLNLMRKNCASIIADSDHRGFQCPLAHASPIYRSLFLSPLSLPD